MDLNGVRQQIQHKESDETMILAGQTTKILSECIKSCLLMQIDVGG